MTKKTIVDITPDKSLIQKLGLTGYKTEQAISELIDNSIDARNKNQVERIDVLLDFEGKTISVADDGDGMDIDGLQGALTIAKNIKFDQDKLGRYGLGMKSACSTLGKVFEIITSKEDSDMEHVVYYDEDEWLKDNLKTWKNFEIESRKKSRPWHGTIIKISTLKVALYQNQTGVYKKNFGIRYAEYMKTNQISLYINSMECKAIKTPIIENSKKILNIDLPSGNSLKGWIGLLEKRSIRGDYGIHLYQNKRLIKAFDKFGIRPHPEVAKIVGELNLDHVPVNFHKTGFIEDSFEYKEAVEMFKTDSEVISALRSSISKSEQVSSIESVFKYFVDNTQEGKLKSRMSAVNSNALLQKADKFNVKIESKNIDFVFENRENHELYNIESMPNGHKITINRKNPLFGIVGNPLFLIALIELEVKEILDDPAKYKEFLQKRNASWSKFVVKWSQKKTKVVKKKPELLIPLKKYNLVNDLTDLHDYLNENFEFNFQFTGLSTLYPFLHNAYNKITYNIETVKGAGQLLLDVIQERTREKFGIVLNPKTQQVRSMIEFSNKTKFIIIREFTKPPTTTWAPPEKAWIDLFVEMKRNTLQITGDELGHILDYLLENSLVKENRIHAIANHRNILLDVEEYLGRVD